MKQQHLTDALSVSDQLTTDDIALVHAMGFKSIVCNRPDGEEPDQALFGAIRAVADRAGLKSAYVPVKLSEPTADDIARMADALGRLPMPLLAYCRTGARSEALLGKIDTGKAQSDET